VASNRKLVAKLAESSNEQWWRIRFWWFQRAGPSASIVQGFAPAGAFVQGRALRQRAETTSVSEASASKQRPGQLSLESVAIQPAPCHNNGFNRTRGKLRAGKAGLAQWPRRLTQTLELMSKHPYIFISLLLASSIANGDEPLRGKPIHYEWGDKRVIYENVIVHGRLQELTIRQPTATYGSAFGHAYCMEEVITYEVENFVVGSGPKLLQFKQHVLDWCNPLSEKIGLGESLLFLSFNSIRGIWTNTGIKLVKLNDELVIIQPQDLAEFLKFTNFEDLEELLTAHEEPLTRYIEREFHTYDMLEALRQRDILDYEEVRVPWPKHPDREMNDTEFYKATVYKYIRLSSLFEVEF